MTLADDTRWLDATEQARLVSAGEVAAEELVDAAIERIERWDAELHAIIHPSFERARRAAAADLPDGPFRGVPFVVKDLSAAAEGEPLCNGNAALAAAGHRAAADTTLVARYRAAGLVFVGRTNTPEFGGLPTTEPVAFGATHNPWDLSRSPGGSSGGTAAAVAAGLVPAGHASDGGGSIRIPASCCGLVGLKVTQGRLSLGPDGDESGFSVHHVLTRSVRDSAGLLDVTWGPAPGDMVVAPPPARPYSDEVGVDPGPLRVGVLAHNPRGALDAECGRAVRRAASMLEALGHHVEEDWPAALDEEAFGARFGLLWAVTMAATAARNGALLGRELGPEDMEPVSWALVEVAQRMSAVDHSALRATMVTFRRQMAAWWASGFDLLLTPTIAVEPWRLGELANDPAAPLAPSLKGGGFVPFTPPFNVTGQPAISLPLHWTPSGLPVGVQLVAAYGREDLLFRVAAQLEAAHPWAERRPSIA
jgi:amidase